MGHCPEWVDKQLFEETLRTFLKDDKLTLNSFNLKAALPSGENFTSDMYRASVDYTTGDGVREKMSLILKLVPDEGFKNDMSVDMFTFEKEMRMYRDVMPEVNKKLGDIRALSAQCLLGQVKPHSLIIMEDLAQFGFRTANRQSGLDLKHSLMVIECLAKLHAASLLLNKEKPDLMKFYNFGLFDHNDQHGKTFIETFTVNAFKALIATMEQWEGFEKYVEKYKKLLPQVTERTQNAVRRDEANFSVLCHGDTWTNNMLFKYDDDQITPIQLKFVDFQLSIFTSPAVDLHYFLFTSPTEDVRINYLDKLLEHYYTYLLKTILQLGCTPEDFQVPTYEQLLADFNKRAFYGVVAATVIMPIIRAPGRDDASLEGMVDGQFDDTFTNFIYNTDGYKHSMSNLLPYFDKLGLLD